MNQLEHFDVANQSARDKTDVDILRSVLYMGTLMLETSF